MPPFAERVRLPSQSKSEEIRPALARGPAPTASPAPLPEALRSGVEALGGFSLADVKVHRDSPEPAKLGAVAFARGRDIHLGPGQERHLPHEAWHVVQQKQGRAPLAPQMKEPGVEAADSLEIEADAMGAKAAGAAAATKRLDYHAMEVTVAAGNRSGQSDELIIAQAYKESRFDPSAKNSQSSATGLLQMTKGAVAEVNRVNKTSYVHSDMTDAAKNIEVGTQYLKICIDRKKTVSAGLDYYGTGPGYSTKILQAETALKARPADPMAELIRIIGKP